MFYGQEALGTKALPLKLRPVGINLRRKASNY